MDDINTARRIAVVFAAGSIGVAMLLMILVARRTWRQFRTRSFAALSAKMQS